MFELEKPINVSILSPDNGAYKSNQTVASLCTKQNGPVRRLVEISERSSVSLVST
jgi:hypothetical protein